MDGLQVFQQEDGTYDGRCFACDTHVPDPYKDRPVGYKPKVKVKSKEDIDRELEEIRECKSLTLTDRKLPVKALEQFGILIGLSRKDGKTINTHHYPYYKDGEFIKFKNRLVHNKMMWHTGHDTKSDVDLFGWEQAVRTGSKRLYITEGELDAPSLFTIIMKNQKREYKDNLPAVVSIPNGAACAKRDISKVLGKIRKHFKEVVLVFDGDKAGLKATEEVLAMCPSWTSAALPCKDPNECLVSGHSKAAFNAVMFNANRPKNTRLVWGEDVHEEAKIQAEFGVSWPWPKVSELTRGIRTGETIYIGAAQKMG